jgi:hypothetical protein
MHYQHLFNNDGNLIGMGLERVELFLKKHGREISIVGKEEPENSVYSGMGISAMVSATVGVGEPAAVPVLRGSDSPHADDRGGDRDKKKHTNFLQSPEQARSHHSRDRLNPFLSPTHAPAKVSTSVLLTTPRETKTELDSRVHKDDISGQVDGISNHSTGTVCPRPTLSVIQSPTSHASVPIIIKTTGEDLERLGSETSTEGGTPSSLGIDSSLVNSSRPSIDSLPPNFDPTIPTLSWIRPEHVHDLTGRLTKVGCRPAFEGTFSNVWMGCLDGKSFVSCVCSPRILELNFLRLLGCNEGVAASGH